MSACLQRALYFGGGQTTASRHGAKFFAKLLSALYDLFLLPKENASVLFCYFLVIHMIQ